MLKAQLLELLSELLVLFGQRLVLPISESDEISKNCQLDEALLHFKPASHFVRAQFSPFLGFALVSFQTALSFLWHPWLLEAFATVEIVLQNLTLDLRNLQLLGKKRTLLFFPQVEIEPRLLL